MTLQCVKFLACKLVLNSCFVSHKLIFLSLNLHLIPYLFLSVFFFFSSLFLAQQIQVIPLHPQQMPGSLSRLFSLCQVSSSGLCNVIHRFLPSLPFWTFMDTCQIVLLRLCFLFADVNFDFTTLLSWPLPWYGSSSSPFSIITEFCHLLGTLVIQHILFVPSWGSFWSFLSYAIIPSHISQFHTFIHTCLWFLLNIWEF